MILLNYLSLVLLGAQLSRRFFKTPYLSLGTGLATYFVLVLAATLLTHDIYTASWIAFAMSVGLNAWLLRQQGIGWIRSALRPHVALLTFLGIYAAFLAYQGAYMEIPSDAVGVHLFRIGDWLSNRYISLGSYDNHLGQSTTYYGYLINTSQVVLSPWNRFVTADWVAVGNSLLLATALYQCAYLALGSSLQAIAAVLLCQLSMGTDIYSYFRYYAFGPSFLNMILLADAIALLFIGLKGHRNLHDLKAQRGTLAWVAVFGAVTFLCHKQETIFIAITALTALTFFSPQRKRILVGLGILAALGVVACIASPSRLQRVNFSNAHDFFSLLRIREFCLFMVSPKASRVRPTLNTAVFVSIGITFAALGISLFQRRWKEDPRRSYFLLLGILPYILIFFPPTASLLSVLFYEEVFYRILYLSPYWIGALLGLRCLWEWHARLAKPLSSMLAALLLIGCFAGKYARGQHFFHLSTEEETSQRWLAAYDYISTLPPGRWHSIYTDPITSYPMNYLAGFHTNWCGGWRCIFPSTATPPPTAILDVVEAATYRDYVVVNTHRDFGESKLAAHWRPDVRDIGLYDSRPYLESIGQMVREGRLKLLHSQDGIDVYENLGAALEKPGTAH